MTPILSFLAMAWLQFHAGGTCVSCDGMFSPFPPPAQSQYAMCWQDGPPMVFMSDVVKACRAAEDWSKR